MADAQAVAVGGFNVPPVPGSASAPAQHQPQNPPANAVAGFVPPASPATTGLTAAQVQEMIAAAAKPPAGVPPPYVPVTPAAPAAAVGEAFDFESDNSSDPVLSSMTAIFLNTAQGIDINRALGNAITRGDPALIDLAYIKEKGGANAANLEALAKGIVDRISTQTNEATNQVYSIANGAENWNAASSAFNTNAPQHVKMVVAQMLDSGDREAIKAGAQMVVDYAKGAGLVPQPAQLLTANGGSLASAQALDKVGFQDAMFKLDENSRSFQADRAALFARRQLGKQLGK